MLNPGQIHQYVERNTGAVKNEELIGDRTIALLYSKLREQAPKMFKMVTSGLMSSALGYWHYDFSIRRKIIGMDLMLKLGIDYNECVEPISYYDTYRKVFERQIKYCDCRPMPDEPQVVLSPADSRILIGSLVETSSLFIKEKLFGLGELLGDKKKHTNYFEQGEYAVFRLTPDKYHYNHLPVSGEVVDIFEVDGTYHSCNPSATIAVASVYSKNRRTITIINTDCEGGTAIGRVAMIEIVALMIGDISQCYSPSKYDNSKPLSIGMFCLRGAPKSLFRPGSSTVVLLFEPGRINFSDDIYANCNRQDVHSRFTNHFSKPLVETDVQVRSEIAKKSDTAQG